MAISRACQVSRRDDEGGASFRGRATESSEREKIVPPPASANRVPVVASLILYRNEKDRP